MRSKNNSDLFVFNNQRFNNYLVRNKSRGKWFEVDSIEKNDNSSPINVSDSLNNKKILVFWLLVLSFGFLVIAGRTAYLQLIKGSYYRDIAEGNRIRILDIKSSRGVIYDRNKNLLVENIPSFSLAIIPVDLPSDENQLKELISGLTEISGKSNEDINKVIKEQSPYSYQPVIIQENLTHDQAILTQILSSRFLGVNLRTSSVRHYLTTTGYPSFSHVLGYEGKIEENKLNEYLDKDYLFDDYVGKAGLELSYEKELRGVYGKEQVEVDATGETKEIIAYQKPVSGKNLVLTIDADLQKQAESSLKSALSAKKMRGSVIVLDPNSGEILALVNWPAFDNNLFSQGISAADFNQLINDSNQPLFSRAISGEYPSGSTFKLVVGAAALQEGIINQNTSFQSVGGIYVDKWFFPDWKAGGHGFTNITRALAESINTFFYIIGGGYKDFAGLGVDKMKEYAEKFGLNKQLGIDLPNEASGFFPSVEWKNKTKGELWYIGDTYHVAIGQGDILVTPLQVAAWTEVFASGGILYKPHLVKEILDSQNQVTREVKPEIINKDFISAKNIQIIKQGLRQAVISGSAKGLYNLPITVAAKTGTAQWSTTKQPHAWLTAFAPYEKPEIVVTVLVEEAGEGSTVALPVARDIINWWAANR